MSAILATLLKNFEKKKDDPFLIYGIAIEYRNEENLTLALEFFRLVYSKFPTYVPTYYHFAQALESQGQTEEAVRVYREGISVATAAKDSHAMSELQQALEMLIDS